jgi:hypothetical protein
MTHSLKKILFVLKKGLAPIFALSGLKLTILPPPPDYLELLECVTTSGYMFLVKIRTFKIACFTNFKNKMT